MKYLGIDYGAKRIGIALSNEGGTIAFPYEIIAQGNTAIAHLKTLVEKEGVGEIVIGESLDMFGKQNTIMDAIAKFSMELCESCDLPIHFEKEFLTSHHASMTHGKEINTARKTKGKATSPIDASAAALILQRFLDKRKNGN